MSRFYFNPHFPEIVSSLPGIREALDDEEHAFVEMMNRRDVELEDYLNGLAQLFRIWAVGNTAGGENSMSEETSTGSYNTAIGAFALQGNTSGVGNTGTGYGALRDNLTGAGNTATGWFALPSSLGERNTGHGAGALLSLVTGSANTAVGHSSGDSLVSGDSNVVIGDTSDVLASDTAGATAVGAIAEAASYGVALGYRTDAAGVGSVAIGTDHTGAGAAAAGENEFVLGTALHTVRVPGVLTAPALDDMDALTWMGGAGSGPEGVPGATGPAGADGGWVPTFVASADTYTVPEDMQVLYALEIDVEGILDVEGALVEVD